MRKTLWYVYPIGGYDFERGALLTNELTELATMEEGNGLRVFAADDGLDMYSQDAVRDDEFGDCYAVQQLVHGNHRLHRHTFHHRGHFIDREYHTFPFYWEEIHLHCVRLFNADRRSLEYACLFDIQLVYGQQSDASYRMGCE